jgi:DNA modification methylase
VKVELWNLEKIKPYPGNPRRNEAAVDAVAASIREFGFRQPLVVDIAGVIICGHARFLAAQKLRLKKVPVHVARGLSEAQIRAYRIADNKTADLSEWDFDLLPIELGQLEDCGFDLSLLGFASDELAGLMGGGAGQGHCDPDEIPAPPDAATTRPGDLWSLGGHRLLCADSSLPADVDRLLGGAQIHLVNTDPPYNVRVEPRSNNAIAAGLSSFPADAKPHYHGFDLARDKQKGKATHKKLRAKDRPLANDFVSDEEFNRLLRAWFGNMARVLRPGHAFYIWGGYANCANYPPVLKACGLYFSQAIIWVKEHPVLTRKDLMGNHEWCFYGWREGAAHRYFGPANAADVWQIKRDRLGAYSMLKGLRLESEDGCRIDVLPPAPDRKIESVHIAADGCCIYGAGASTDVWSVKKINPQSMIHLTEKPVELAARAMKYSTKPGENVLDLFGGSGSTLIAAEQFGRHAFLLELDALYCDVIVAPWEKFTGRKAKRKRGR